MASCPICEQPIPASSEHCEVCGFPTALAIEGLRAAQQPIADGPAPRHSGERAMPPRARPTLVPAPETQLTSAIAAGLGDRMAALRPLGRDAPDVTTEMCEAALSEASGRSSEALEILRSAQSRLDRQARDAIHRRFESAHDRRQALERTGGQLAFDVPTAAGLAIETPEQISATLIRLLDAERRLGKMEADWKGIQGLLAQIEALRSEATELAIPLGEVPTQIAELRGRLGAGPLLESDLDQLSQDAARTLMLLHEAVPTALEAELGRHEAVLAALPEGHDRGASARKLHEETTAHLRKGRLVEASQGLRELRRAIAELDTPVAPAPVARPRPPPPSAPGAAASAAALFDDAALGLLLKKARSLAGRVRTLPPDSPLALEAAAQIREATDLLRGGRLSDADRTLTELMRTLSREEAPR